MTFFGLPRGRNKALNTVRITINNSSLTNNATIYYDSGFGNGQSGGTGTTVTFYPGTWLALYATGGSGTATSVGTTVNNLEIFDSNGNTNRIGTGTPGSQVDLLLDLPGGNGFIPVLVVSGTQIWIQPITAPAVGAEVDINWYD